MIPVFVALLPQSLSISYLYTCLCHSLRPQTGSREQAFVYSLSSAVLVHTVAKACSTDQSSKCQCGPIPSHSAPAGHRWGGCSDDLDFAVAFSQQFTDSQWTTGRRQPSKRALVNLQNNAAGRQVGQRVISLPVGLQVRIPLAISLEGFRTVSIVPPFIYLLSSCIAKPWAEKMITFTRVFKLSSKRTFFITLHIHFKAITMT